MKWILVGCFLFTLAVAWLTPPQVIAAATINAAAANQAGSSIGSIKAGKQAHLLVLNTDNYRQPGYRFSTNKMQTIIKGEYTINIGENN